MFITITGSICPLVFNSRDFRSKMLKNWIIFRFFLLVISLRNKFKKMLFFYLKVVKPPRTGI